MFSLKERKIIMEWISVEDRLLDEAGEYLVINNQDVGLEAATHSKSA